LPPRTSTLSLHDALPIYPADPERAHDQEGVAPRARLLLRNQGDDNERRDDGADGGAALEDAVAQRPLGRRQDALHRPQSAGPVTDRKSTRLNSSHLGISY